MLKWLLQRSFYYEKVHVVFHDIDIDGRLQFTVETGDNTGTDPDTCSDCRSDRRADHRADSDPDGNTRTH